MSTFKLLILTPDGKVYENDIVSLVAPGENGFFGILANHAPLIATTVPGVFKVKEEQELFFAVGGGMIEVSDNSAVFLADSAEQANDSENAKRKATKLV